LRQKVNPDAALRQSGGRRAFSTGPFPLAATAIPW
jgi:hypothetical protein